MVFFKPLSILVWFPLVNFVIFFILDFKSFTSLYLGLTLNLSDFIFTLTLINFDILLTRSLIEIFELFPTFTTSPKSFYF